MDSSPSLQVSQLSGSINYQKASIQFSKEKLVLESTTISASYDTVDVDFDELYKSLQVKAQKVVDKLNEVLKAKLPDGIASLKPEEVTPEATADRIVSGATALFDAFAKSNPDLQGEELLKRFMDAVRSGVKQGYEDAAGTLEALGAFEFEGVKDGIEKTMQLIEEKLQIFEEQKRKDLGLSEAGQQEEIAQNVTEELLKQAGKSISLTV